jgi:hypothetical protein
MTDTRPDPAREQRVDRVVDRLTAAPLPVRDGLLVAPNLAHDEHDYDAWCGICRAGHLPDALRALVGAVLDADDAEKRRGTLRSGPDGARVEFDYLDACSDAPPVRMVGRIVAMTGSRAPDSRWATVRVDGGREYEVPMSELRKVAQP